MKLNLGCGAQTPMGWLNVDYSLGARLSKVPLFRVINKRLRLFDIDWDDTIYLHDLTKKFPWAENSIDVVYSSHTLEHFTKDDGKKFISECYRVLRTGGIIRIVVPDLHHLVMEYIEGRIKADDFVGNIGVLYEDNKNSTKDRLAHFVRFPHKCMYDSTRLVEILTVMGFNASSRSPFDSDIEDIRMIELEGRTKNAVIVEGRKR